jgi:hypothetical protein
MITMFWAFLSIIHISVEFFFIIINDTVMKYLLILFSTSFVTTAQLQKKISCCLHYFISQYLIHVTYNFVISKFSVIYFKLINFIFRISVPKSRDLRRIRCHNYRNHVHYIITGYENSQLPLIIIVYFAFFFHF